jgi:hypothetical protein
MNKEQAATEQEGDKEATNLSNGHEKSRRLGSSRMLQYVASTLGFAIRVADRLTFFGARFFQKMLWLTCPAQHGQGVRCHNAREAGRRQQPGDGHHQTRAGRLRDKGACCSQGGPPPTHPQNWDWDLARGAAWGVSPPPLNLMAPWRATMVGVSPRACAPSSFSRAALYPFTYVCARQEQARAPFHMQNGKHSLRAHNVKDCTTLPSVGSFSTSF